LRYEIRCRKESFEIGQLSLLVQEGAERRPRSSP
jgi:hypothetical protein